MVFHCNIFSQYKVNVYVSGWLVWFMLFSTTFYSISAISWLSVLLVEATGIPVETYRPTTSYWQTLSPNFVLLALSEIRTQVRCRACMGLEILQMRECVQIVQYNTNLVFNLKKLIDVFSLKIMSSLPIIFIPIVSMNLLIFRHIMHCLLLSHV
jgi:hypothetical protein